MSTNAVPALGRFATRGGGGRQAAVASGIRLPAGRTVDCPAAPLLIGSLFRTVPAVDETEYLIAALRDRFPALRAPKSDEVVTALGGLGPVTAGRRHVATGSVELLLPRQVRP